VRRKDGKPKRRPTSKTIETSLLAFGKLAARGWPPSYRELVAELGLRSTSVIRYRISVLERLGYVERFGSEGMNRSYRLTPEGRAAYDRLRAGEEIAV
jgi:SOS-response transcriptional repressor LexA